MTLTQRWPWLGGALRRLGWELLVLAGAAAAFAALFVLLSLAFYGRVRW